MYKGGRETSRWLLHVSHLILLFSRHSHLSPESMSILKRRDESILGSGKLDTAEERDGPGKYENESLGAKLYLLKTPLDLMSRDKLFVKGPF